MYCSVFLLQPPILMLESMFLVHSSPTTLVQPWSLIYVLECYRNIQIGNENLKSLVGIVNPLIIQCVIINIPTALIYYEKGGHTHKH